MVAFRHSVAWIDTPRIRYGARAQQVVQNMGLGGRICWSPGAPDFAGGWRREAPVSGKLSRRPGRGPLETSESRW